MNFKEIVKIFTSKFVGTGPSSYKKNNLLGRGLTKVEEHCCIVCFTCISISTLPPTRLLILIHVTE